jgi:ferritin-like metal-binding protein YciE
LDIQTLEDLFYEQLQGLYDEEQQLVEALPKMARAAASARLREGFQEHLQQTRSHVTRLEECFREIGRSADTQKASGMKGLIEEGERFMGRIEQSPLRDAALIGAARRVEHYEIAAYTGAISITRVLGHQKSMRLLEETLREERETDSKLHEIAESTVNQEALQLGAHQRG